MKKQEIIEFFDRHAQGWDAGMIRDDAKIGAILDAARVCPGCRVLDVACGTGVLFPDYLERGVAQVVAVDISPEMTKIAAQKAEDPRILVRCGDVEELVFDALFDSIVVYNAFPHFPEPGRLLARLSSLLVPGGVLCVAHGMSLDALHRHHAHARSVSRTMLTPQALCALLPGELAVTMAVADDEKYIVAAMRARQDCE
ncbi:MAG: class I SAM-dependent methyltransferase [Clostridia bacterium]|nr:class I SAM-dependent methyltransferase [Clostridia bacterium]